MGTSLSTPRKGFWRTFWKTVLLTWIAITVMSLWLPVRVSIVKAMIRFGADRLFIGAEYDEINDPAYISISEASIYASDTEVVALEVNGDARAIPLKRLANYLVLNDMIGGEHVTIAYCHVSDVVMAYRATCRDKKTLTFTPSRLARNNLVMRDLETQSDWQQFTGRSIAGPLKDCQLQHVSVERLKIADWMKKHPSGRVLKPAGNSYDRVAPNDTCPVMSYFPSEPFLLQEPTAENDRVPRKQRVAGMTLENGDAVACSKDQQDLVERSIPIVQTYWFAWTEFHPSTKYIESCRDMNR